MTAEFAFSRHHLPEVLQSTFALSKSEGAGKTGCSPHPRSRRQCAKRCCLRAYRFGGITPAFPAQWLYGLYDFVLVTGFLATIIRFEAFASRRLDASTGASDPNDFAVRSSPLVVACLYVHRFPAPRLRRWPTPLWWDRMAGVLFLICPTGPAIYFLRPDWTGQISLKLLRKLVCARRGHLPSLRGAKRRAIQHAATKDWIASLRSHDGVRLQNPFKSGSSVWPSSSWTPNVFSSIETWVYWPTANTTSMRCCSLKCFVSSVQTGSLMK